MIDHVSLAVKDFAEGLKFYDATLAILGYKRLMTFDLPEVKAAGYGKDPKPSFWISPDGMGPEDEVIGKGKGVHVAFLAEKVEDVQEWFKTCLANGGKSNGEPGPRAHYHPGYYGAFVVDPNGWRIEACLHHYQP